MDKCLISILQDAAHSMILQCHREYFFLIDNMRCALSDNHVVLWFV